MDHLNNIGRDEMNLAEFPLATLADRAPRGCKTLVFEDRIWDKGQSQQCVRRLTISASDKYGLPTAIDDEVILGLVQASMTAGFADRRVRFSRYQLIQLLGWRDEGRSYTRLERSLKRWLGVTLYYENAWWDKARKRWVDAHFHLLDDLILYRRPKPSIGVRAKAGDVALSSFTWNEVIFHSFQAGWLRKLNLNFYRSLKLAVTKRMYRFLDKHFHKSRKLRFKLPVFACEHIGLSRSYDVAQLKRRLIPAIVELEQAGYLVPLPAEERFQRLRRGHWEVVFIRAPKVRQSRLPGSPSSVLETLLIDRGVTFSMAIRLVREHPADLIRSKLAVFDTLRQRKDRLISKNPPGFLVKSIQENYLPPAGFERNDSCSAARRPADIMPALSTPARRSDADKSDRFYVEQKAMQDYVARLSPADLIQLEEKAVKASPPFLSKRYASAKESGSPTLIAEYRRCVLEHHVRTILGLN